MSTVAGGSTNATGSGSALAVSTHRHTTTFDTSAVVGGGLSEVACTYAAISNDPPYYSVIFIKPTTSKSNLPNLGVYLYEDTDSKTGHYVCDGNNSTPNLVDKYLKGAGTGANAGTTGGSVTNVHDLTHTHTVASHTHTRTSPAAERLGSNEAGATNWAGSHTHAITTGSQTATISATEPELTTTETVEPAYTKLLTIQNRTGHGDVRVGMIGMWLGTLANIPANYELTTTDMKGRHLKSTATSGDIADTGGANTHTHASQNHTHTASGTHTHTCANASHSGATNSNEDSGTSYNAVSMDSYHTVAVGSGTSTYANASTEGDSQSNEPEYRTVAFIKLKSVVQGGAAMMTMLGSYFPRI
jgi:hypothetical protein